MPKLPEKFEDWTPPWVANGTEFDADAAAKLIFNVKRELETTQETHASKVADLQGQLEAKDGELTQAQAKVNELSDAQIEDAEERRRVQEERRWERIEAALLGKKPEGGEQEGKGGVTESDRLRAALKHGLSEADAARLVGNTPEELLADAESFKKRLNGESGDDPDAGGDDVGYDGGSDNGEMPSGVPGRMGYRTNLGGSLGGRSFDPAKERDSMPRR